MPITYKKLFHLLLDMGIKKGELQEKAGITASIMARLARDESVRTETIAKICEALRCQPGDIMEYIEIDDLVTNDNKPTEYKLITIPNLHGEEIETVISKQRAEEEY